MMRGRSEARFKERELWKRAAKPGAELYKDLADFKDYGFRDQGRHRLTEAEEISKMRHGLNRSVRSPTP